MVGAGVSNRSGRATSSAQVPRPVAICADMARTRSPGAKPGARLATTMPARSQPRVAGRAGPVSSQARVFQSTGLRLHLARTAHGLGHLPDGEYLGASVNVHLHGTHDATPRERAGVDQLASPL